MQTLLPWLGALGLALASTPRGQAAPAQSMPPGLQRLDAGAVTPIHCHRYRHYQPLPAARVGRLPQGRELLSSLLALPGRALLRAALAARLAFARSDLAS